jgi:hypothetical protein
MQATLLTCKKESEKITFLQSIKLKMHYSICTGCKNFAAQSTFICNNAKYAAEYSDAVLAPQKKQEIKEKMV